MIKRIDLHGHYMPPAYYETLEKNHVQLLDGVKAPFWSVERQFDIMEKLNIGFSTLSLSSPYPFFENSTQGEVAEVIRGCNEYGSSLQKEYPDKFRALASLPLTDINKSLEEIKYCREKLDVPGFALLSNYNGMYLGDKRLDPIMEELNKEPTLVTIHPTVPTVEIEGVCEELPGPIMEYFFETTRAVTNMLLKGIVHRYPNIKFIVPHGGSVLAILADRMIPLTDILLKDRGLTMAEDLKNMYYDLAGYAMPKQFGLLRKITSDEHLVYGSDSPHAFLPICETQSKDMEKMLDDRLKNLVYKDNAMALLEKTGLVKNISI